MKLYFVFFKIGGWLPWFLGTTSSLIIGVYFFHDMRDTLKNTSETLNGKIDTLGETNMLIAKNILKATQMQIESSQNSNEALEKVGKEISTELRALKESNLLIAKEVELLKESNEQISQNSGDDLKSQGPKILESSPSYVYLRDSPRQSKIVPDSPI